MKKGSQTPTKSVFKFLSIFQMNSALCLRREDSAEPGAGCRWEAEEAEHSSKLLPTVGETVQSLNLVKLARLDKHHGLSPDTQKGHSLGVQ